MRAGCPEIRGTTGIGDWETLMQPRTCRKCGKVAPLDPCYTCFWGAVERERRFLRRMERILVLPCFAIVVGCLLVSVAGLVGWL